MYVYVFFKLPELFVQLPVIYFAMHTVQFTSRHILSFVLHFVQWYINIYCEFKSFCLFYY